MKLCSHYYCMHASVTAKYDWRTSQSVAKCGRWWNRQWCVFLVRTMRLHVKIKSQTWYVQFARNVYTSPAPNPMMMTFPFKFCMFSSRVQHATVETVAFLISDCISNWETILGNQKVFLFASMLSLNTPLTYWVCTLNVSMYTGSMSGMSMEHVLVPMEQSKMN